MSRGGELIGMYILFRLCEMFSFSLFFLDFHSFCLCIAVNLHKSHCVQASYQGGFNLFHKRF
uniref:Uncharacterized protein n=1 Tax=Brassica campestris TaxID=3711 RepID=A0A3P6A4Y5_BRACM|nr:unnamed protein product [Brassica rapa]